jgi:hypothetical protein
MADNADTPQTDLEARPEGEQTPATPAPPQPQATPEAPQDDLNPKAGETLEAYAARVRGEVNWRSKQIDRQHRKIKETEAQQVRLAEIEAENQRLRDLAQMRQPGATTQPPAAPVSQPPRQQPQAGVDPGTMAAARRQIGIERTSEQLAKIPEWTAASANFERAGGIPMDLMDSVLVTDDPAYVLVTLGKDMNRFQQVMDMPPDRRTAALIKIGMEPALKAEPKPEVRRPSEAPAPRTGLPAGGSAAPDEGGFVPDRDDRVVPDERMQYSPDRDRYRSDEHDQAWYAARRRQKLNSEGRPWSPGGRPRT